MSAAAVAAAVLLALPVRRSARARLGDVTVRSSTLSGPLRWYTARSETRQRSRDVVAVLRAIAAQLRAGAVTADALRAAAGESAAWRGELEASATAVARGADVTTELGRLAALPGGEALRPLAAVWGAGIAVGAPMAGIVDRVAEVLDAEAVGRAELAAEMEGARATAFLLAMLPVAGVGLGEAVGAAPLRLLVHRPLGWGLAIVAGVLDALGVLWVRRLSRVA